MLDPNNFLMTTKKSTSHDALRIALVDFFCKDIKICFFAGDRHWNLSGPRKRPHPQINFQSSPLNQIQYLLNILLSKGYFIFVDNKTRDTHYVVLLFFLTKMIDVINLGYNKRI